MATMKVLVEPVPRPVTYSLKGNGPDDTNVFTVPASAPWWQVNWSYNCHPSGSTSIFDWAVNTSTGADYNDSAPNQLGWGFTAAERYADHGTFYLDINTDPGCV